MSLSGELGLSRLCNNTARTFLRQSIAIFFGLGSSILLARFLGPEGNGMYAMCIFLPSILASFLNFGIAPANVYYIASKKITPYHAFRTSFWLWLILSIIGVTVAIITIMTRSQAWFTGIPTNLLLLAILAFPFTLLQAFSGSLFQGLQDFKHYNVVLLVTPGVTLSISIILVGLFNQGVFGALIAFIGGNLIGLVVTLLILWPYIHKNDESKDNEVSAHYTKTCVNFGWKSHLSNILTFINYRADLFFVNFFLNPAATGVYVIAVQLAESLWMLSNSVSIVIFPRLSELNKSEDTRRQLTPLISRWLLFLSAGGAVIISLFAPPFIKLLYGNEFLTAIGALQWLLPGILVGSVSRVLANDIAARGKPELNLYIALITVSFNIVSNIILIPIFGLKGAAIATTLAYTLDAVAKLWLYARLSGNSWWKPILFNADDLQLFQTFLLLIKKKVSNFI